MYCLCVFQERIILIVLGVEGQLKETKLYECKNAVLVCDCKQRT